MVEGKEKVQFDRDGFIHIPGVLTEWVDPILAELATLEATASERYAQRAANGEITFYTGAHKGRQVLQNLRESNILLDLVSEILGEKARPRAVQYRAAASKGASEVFPHQDADGLCLRPAKSVAVWVSLGKYGPDHGCMRYLPGSHKRGFQPQAFGTLPNPNYIIEDETIVPTDPGDIIIHDSFTLHRSAQNTTGLPRPALAITFEADSSVRIDPASWYAEHGQHNRVPSHQDRIKTTPEHTTA